jgi:hypothetical protein
VRTQKPEIPPGERLARLQKSMAIHETEVMQFLLNSNRNIKHEMGHLALRTMLEDVTCSEGMGL